MELFILKIVAAVILPLVLTVLLTRATFNEWVGLLIAVGFVGGVFGDMLKVNGEYNMIVVGIASVSLLVGFALSVKLKMKLVKSKKIG